MANIITIGIINDADMFGRQLVTIWLNHLARIFSLKFLNETDEVYFQSLIHLLKKIKIPWKMNIQFEIPPLRKTIRMIEFNSDNLLSNTVEGSLERANLGYVKNAILITNKSITRPAPLLKMILKKMGKRRFIRKIVRQPFAIVLNSENIVTEQTLQFLERRYKRYKLFYIDKPKLERLEKINTEKISEPLIWILEQSLRKRIITYI